MAGVIPPIFASSIILFPVTIIGWFGGSNNVGWMQKLLLWLQHGNSVYISFFAVSIIFFCYFYTALVFSPKEMAENLKKSGAFVPGVRPGIQTSLYLENVVMRILLNYYPAVSEAYYSNIPLVVISADRPASKIDIGDGQTIHQRHALALHTSA